MKNILHEVRSDLVAAENNNPGLTFWPDNTPGALGHSFTWNDCIKYLALAGVDETNSFIQEYPEGSIEHTLWVRYNVTLNKKNLFNQNVCD